MNLSLSITVISLILVASGVSGLAFACPLGSSKSGISVDMSGPQVPHWIKTEAKWWTTGQIADTEFVQGMQYLAQQGVITVSPAQSVSTSQGIPSWVRSDTSLWSSNQISDGEFVKAMQYLVDNGVLRI